MSSIESKENANAPHHYLLLTVYIIVGLFGVYFRFVGEGHLLPHITYSAVSNVVLIIGSFLAIRQVFRIME